MKTVNCQILVLGGGFAGSLLAMILKRIGFDAALFDRAQHPRFAIGESSTPTANMVLAALAQRYDLPRLLPLAKFGSWQETYPHLTCGCKRGFSYFAHQKNRPFAAAPNHGNALLVAASSSREQADTQWLRADVDAFLFDEAAALGVQTEEQVELNAAHYDGAWRLGGVQNGEPLEVRARFVVDATGPAAWLPRMLGVAKANVRFRTNSWAIYSHFDHLPPWSDMLDAASPSTRADHPFPCDEAAQHHLLETSWLWRLRFLDGRTSAGLVFDGRRRQPPNAASAQQLWRRTLADYPALQEQFTEAALAASPGKLILSPRLQRRLQQAVGPGWAALPHTAGFIDPLHSTGIAHSLCGIERLASILEQHFSKDSLPSTLCGYQRALFSELAMIDHLASSCYDALTDFRLFAACTMLYFAAATYYEQTRTAGGPVRQFLCADELPLRRAVARISHEAKRLSGQHRVTTNMAARFEQSVAEAIRPYNRVGLCDPGAMNRYRHTIAPQE